VKALDKAVTDAREAVSATTDSDLQTPWRLLQGGKVAMENPRYSFIMDNFNHLAHHRGQLTVYLRMNDAQVPAIYGPSADDHRFEERATQLVAAAGPCQRIEAFAEQLVYTIVEALRLDPGLSGLR
jgi:uncharacterized damage-inducible protein DinB